MLDCLCKPKRYKPNEPDWILHDGEVCPVPEDHMVEIQCSDGVRIKGRASIFRWNKLGRECDISAYRDWTVWEQEQDDLLPQPGDDCSGLLEYGAHGGNYRWRPVEFLKEIDGKYAVMDLTTGELQWAKGVQRQTHRDKAVFAMEKVIKEDSTESGMLGKSKAIYDAIRDGKIPGVKIDDNS